MLTILLIAGIILFAVGVYSTFRTYSDMRRGITKCETIEYAASMAITFTCIMLGAGTTLICVALRIKEMVG